MLGHGKNKIILNLTKFEISSIGLGTDGILYFHIIVLPIITNFHLFSGKLSLIAVKLCNQG